MGLYTCKSVQSLPNMIINVYLWGSFLALILHVYSPKRPLDLFGTCIYKIRRPKNENIGN